MRATYEALGSLGKVCDGWDGVLEGLGQLKIQYQI